MTTEQPKTLTPAPASAPETPYTPTPAPAPAPASVPPQLPPFNGVFPPGYPPFFTYPPPPADGQQAEGAGAAPLPYPIMYPPPGVVYAFPPQPPPATPATSAASSRPKRRQVKMACTNCAAACKRCDETRPCERCKKYGIEAGCVDGQRKERKKGIKRGPYKRKNKSSDDNFEYTQQPPPEGGGGEWVQGGSSPPPNTATTTAAIHAVAQFPPPPEGFYPIYIPPGYPLPEGPPNSDGSATSAGPPALMPIYMGFAPYAYPPGAIFQLPPPGTHPPPPPGSQPPTAEAGSVSATDKSSEEVDTAQIVASTSVSPADVTMEDGADKASKGSGKTDSEATKAPEGSDTPADRDEPATNHS